MKKRALFAFLLLLTLPASIGNADRAPRKVRIEMDEFKFTLSDSVLEKGEPVALTLTNRGKVLHEFEGDLFKGADVEMTWDGGAVEGIGIHEVELFPGKSAEILFTPRTRGEIEFVCKQPGHLEKGMKGTIVIR